MHTAVAEAAPVLWTPGGSRAREWANEQERDAWYWNVRPSNEVEQLAWLLLRWRVDPVLYAIECTRTRVTPYQAHVLLDLADAPLEVYAFYGLDPSHPKRQVLVGSGHGLGKTRTEAIALHWHKDTHRFSKALVTAPSADQITGQLWGEIGKLHRRMKERWPMIAGEWEIQTSAIVHANPDFKDWYVKARTARADTPEGLQGGHAMDDDDEFNELATLFGEEVDDSPSGGMLVVIEEASGVSNGIREVLQGALSEPGARLLGMGNPTRPDGWFADDLDKPHRYAIHTLDCRMSDASKIYSVPYRDLSGRVHEIRIRGRVQPSYWEGILEDCAHDEDHDRVRVRVRGLKPRSAFEQTVKTHWVEEAENRARDEASRAEPIVLGLDFGLSSDKHALAARQGFNILDGEEWLPKDKPEEVTLDAAERAIEAEGRYRPLVKYIIGDANGVGRGAMEYLSKYYREEHPELGVTVIFFNSGEGALDDKRYYRRRDEMWFREGRKFFSNPRTSLPKIAGLKRQLTTPGYHEDAKRKIKVESKDDVFKRTGEPSGNLADAILQTLMIVAPVVEEKKPATVPGLNLEADKFHPANFQEHWKRWEAQRLNASGWYIR